MKCIKLTVASWTACLFATTLPLSAQNGAAQNGVVSNGAIQNGAMQNGAAGKAAAQPAEASVKQQGPGVRIGVVDVVKAVEQYPRYIAMMNAFADGVETKKQEIVALRQRMDEVRATMGALDEDSPKYADAAFELSFGRQREDYLRKRFEAESQAEQDQIRVRVYRDLEKAIAKVAAQKGVDMVMTRTPAPTVDDDSKLTRRDWNLLARAYEQQQIWFAAEQLDLTGDVIKLMQVPLEDAPKTSGNTPAGGSRGGQ